jgi:hypothetical protein
MPLDKRLTRILATLLLDFYVLGVGTLIAPLGLLWLFFTGHRDLAWAVLLVLPLPMLVVLLVVMPHDRSRP